jgi:hypothetical protein
MESFLDYIPQIAAAGAMGVSILCIFRVYNLLKNEQEKDQPRPVFLRSIYIFMGFGVLMTILSLGIEFSRHFMGDGGNQQEVLTKKLVAIDSANYYSLDKNGNPASISVDVAGKDYDLSQALPDDFLQNTELKLKAGGDGKYLAVKRNNGKETVFGFLNASELKSSLGDLLVDTTRTAPKLPTVPNQLLESEKLLFAGVMYSPTSRVRTSVQQKLSGKKANSKVANRYLVDFVHTEGFDEELQTLAVKLLIQPKQMNALDAGEYEKLVSVLSSDGVRDAPWRHYELAQVYYSRYGKTDNPDDLENYRNALRAYIAAYDRLTWISNAPDDYPVELTWYNEAKATL